MTAPDSAWLLPLVDLALLISGLEMLWLLVGRRPAPALAPLAPGAPNPPFPWPLVANLGAGLGLMLALRLALHGAAGWAIAGCLTAAGLAHVLDLRGRLPSPDPERPGP